MKPKSNGFATATCVVMLIASVVLSPSSHQVFGQEAAQTDDTKSKTLAEQLIGSWRLEAAVNPGSPSGIGTRLKLFTGSHWCVIQPDPATSVIVFQHGGRYEIDGVTLKTTRDFAGESTKSLIGGSGKFKIKIEGDSMKQADSKGVYNETWIRVR